MNLNELIDEILEKFHEKHRKDLEELIPLARRVEEVHSDHEEVPRGLSQFLESLSLELESHMQKEEQILFPMIRSGRGNMASRAISVMTHEHVEHEENLKKMKVLAKSYILPERACGSWQRLYSGVEILEKEITEHIKLENETLFPQVLSN